MATFIVKAKADGGIEMTDYQRATWRTLIKQHANKQLRIVMDAVVPESSNQRRFYHGAVLVLWAFLDGNDYRSSETMNYYHEMAKREFNPHIIIVNGKKVKVGKSSRGSLNSGYIEKIIEYLQENYGIDPAQVLNPELYKDYRDRVYMSGKYDTFIDYMKDLKLL